MCFGDLCIPVPCSTIQLLNKFWSNATSKILLMGHVLQAYRCGEGHLKVKITLDLAYALEVYGYPFPVLPFRLRR